jgi:hypothetical protein
MTPGCLRGQHDAPARHPLKVILEKVCDCRSRIAAILERPPPHFFYPLSHRPTIVLVHVQLRGQNIEHVVPRLPHGVLEMIDEF